MLTHFGYLETSIVCEANDRLVELEDRNLGFILKQLKRLESSECCCCLWYESGSRIQPTFQKLDRLTLCGHPAPTEIQPDFVNLVVIYDNKVVICSLDGEHTQLARLVTKLNSKPHLLERRFLEESPVPNLVNVPLSISRCSPIEYIP
jgi:hypothetical protein